MVVKERPPIHMGDLLIDKFNAWGFYDGAR